MARRQHRLRLPIAAAVVVVVGGAGTAYAVTGSEDVPRYRTVAAATSDVEQTLSSSGLVDAAARADLDFGTDGTVKALRVAIGDTVRTGQVLATLDTTELDAAVTEAEASVAKAVAQLAADRASQTSSVSRASTSTPAPTPGTGSSQLGTGSSQPDSGDAAATTALLAKLKKLQDGVVAAQRAASRALAAARTALATQNEVCAEASAEPSTGPTTDPTSDPTADATAEATVSSDAQDACAAALAEVADRQDDVSAAQDALATALDDLAGVLTEALGSVGRSASPQTNGRTTASTTTAPSTSSSSGSPTSSGTTVTAARLASDQAQIEQAKADLVSAQQDREQATLRSTRPGKVVALGTAVGETVTAGTTVATVVGGKAVTVVGSATESQVDQLEVGQVVRVTVPGSTTVAEGRLSAISLVADTSSGTTSYPFTVTVEDPSIALPTGSRALLQVVLATATDVVSVPTSAVTRTRDTASVQVVEGGKSAIRTVTIGAVGARTVQVLSGLDEGQKVVLAAMDDPIEGADAELDQRGNFGGPPTVRLGGSPGGAGGGSRTFTSGG